MYAKIAKYGQQAQDQQGQICGQISIEVLPQGNLAHHINLEIQEIGKLAKHPEPMVVLSINNQRNISCSLSELVKIIELSCVKPEVIGQDITEPSINPKEMEKGIYYVGENSRNEDFIVFICGEVSRDLIYTICSYDSNPEEGEKQFEEGIIFNVECYERYRLATAEDIAKYLPAK